MQSEDVHSCQYVDWFKFVTCSIKTCKNYTDVTKTHCLALDRKKPEGAKPISDSELNMYKLGDLKISTRLVQMKRKKAIDRVKHTLVLRQFIAFIAERETGGGVFKTTSTILAETDFPLNIKKLGWQNWMWEYLLDEKVWAQFAAKHKGECSSYTVQMLLSMTQSKFDKLVKELNL